MVEADGKQAEAHYPENPSWLKGLHLSLYSLSSGEGKIVNFENPSFSKFWYRGTTR